MLMTIEYPRVFEDLVEEFFTGTVRERAFPAMDMIENDTNYLLVAEMPGVKKDDFRVKVEDGVLTITGERKPYEIPENAHVILNEMRVRDFHRVVELPDDVDTNGISAELENGVLRIRMPKRPEAQPRMIEIK